MYPLPSLIRDHVHLYNIHPSLQAAKAAEDAAEKARKKELENERRAAASRGKQISGGPIADLSMD